MAEETVVVDPQKTPQAEVVTVPKSEWEDTKHKAEVSSQNFERLKAEEAKRKELETRLADLEANPVPLGNDEEMGKLRNDIAVLKQNAAKGEVLEAYPHLKDVWSDFESFRSTDENKGMNLKTAAKSFMVEKGLLDPTRKGLEKPSGGTRQPDASVMTSEDVKVLRETNYKKYSEMVQKGQIKI